jgi:hypothetical protein
MGEVSIIWDAPRFHEDDERAAEPQPKASEVQKSTDVESRAFQTSIAFQRAFGSPNRPDMREHSASFENDIFDEFSRAHPFKGLRVAEVRCKSRAPQITIRSTSSRLSSSSRRS